MIGKNQKLVTNIIDYAIAVVANVGDSRVYVYRDGEPLNLPSRMAYKGMMLSDVPNFAFTVGYTNASWTLKADLVAEYFCRLLNHMDAHGYRMCVPRHDPSMPEEPFMDFTSGYVQRSLHLFPKQGSEWPWRLRQNYPMDILQIRHGSLEDSAMEFSRGGLDALQAREGGGLVAHQANQVA